MSTYNDFTIEQTRSAALLARILDQAPEGTTLDVLEATELQCRVKVKRPDRFAKPVTIAYTLAEALAAGSMDADADRDRWRRATADSLHWACMRRVARRMFPDFTWDTLDQLTAPARADIVAELGQIDGQ
jgi:hypothetical protein